MAGITINNVHIDHGEYKLKGRVYRANGDDPKPSAIICHGYPGDTKNMDLAEELAFNGYNVLVFFYMGAWGSECGAGLRPHTARWGCQRGPGVGLERPLRKTLRRLKGHVVAYADAATPAVAAVLLALLARGAIGIARTAGDLRQADSVAPAIAAIDVTALAWVAVGVRRASRHVGDGGSHALFRRHLASHPRAAVRVGEAAHLHLYAGPLAVSTGSAGHHAQLACATIGVLDTATGAVRVRPHAQPVLDEGVVADAVAVVPELRADVAPGRQAELVALVDAAVLPLQQLLLLVGQCVLRAAISDTTTDTEAVDAEQAETSWDPRLRTALALQRALEACRIHNQAPEAMSIDEREQSTSRWWWKRG